MIDNKPICVDICSGLGGFSEDFDTRGWVVYRYELNPNSAIRGIAGDTITTIGDILEMELDQFPMNPEILVASPPCTTFSVASIRYHWEKLPDGTIKPKSEACKTAIKLVKKILEIIEYTKPKFWIIENPRAMMRRVMNDIIGIGKPTQTTFWCSWGERNYKPTDLWGIIPPMIFPEPVEWEKAPRGSRTGTQGVKRDRDAGMPKELSVNMLRSIIPYQFSNALCLATEKALGLVLESDKWFEKITYSEIGIAL